MARAFAKSFYNSKEWKKLRKRVFDEACGLCEQCGEPGLEVDHIIELSPENIEDKNITLNRENLRLLCFRCHKKKNKKKKTERVCLFDMNGDMIGIYEEIPPSDKN